MKNKTQYISLQKATEYCDYSQEYLALRARQGKLKAAKIGRNWVTKKEWIEEYLNFYNNKTQRDNNKTQRIAMPRVIEPPENLPIETPTIKLSIKQPIPKIRFGFVVVLIFVSLISGLFFFWQTQPKISYEETAKIVATMSSKEVRASTIDTFRKYGQWLGFQIPKIKTAYFVADDFIKRKLDQGYQRITQILKFQEKVSEEKLTPESTKEGVVVIPYSGEEEVKEKIKEAFSDEIRVEPEDKTSGIIIPIFREREGEKYLYMIVPMKN